MEIDAIFYDLPDGTEPANEFIRGLDRKMRAEIDRAKKYRNEYLDRKENR